MPLNNFILACAGAGKTTKLVNLALEHKDKRILMVTYTNINTETIKNKIEEINGFIPKNITIMTWFSFLLNECAKPYQNMYFKKFKIEGLDTSIEGVSAERIPEYNIEFHYFNDKNQIYKDKISKFILKCNSALPNCVINRLAELYSVLMIDEVQDLSGWDLSFVEEILNCNKIQTILVGDVRQQTFKTNNGTKNSKFSNNKFQWFKYLQSKNLGEITELNNSYRCVAEICKFADHLFPYMPKTKSLNNLCDSHKGIYLLAKENANKYIKEYSPLILRYSKNSSSVFITEKVNIINFGCSKGITVNRVLIIPTKNILNYLKTGNLSNINSIKEKLYVAITRARFSVAFAVDNLNCFDNNVLIWSPKSNI